MGLPIFFFFSKISARSKILSRFLPTYEAGRVVVTDGLGVTVGLQRRVGLNNLLLKGTGVGTLGGLGLGGLQKKESGSMNHS